MKIEDDVAHDYLLKTFCRKHFSSAFKLSPNRPHFQQIPAKHNGKLG